MLAGISSTQSSAHACFELLRFAKGINLEFKLIFIYFVWKKNRYRWTDMLESNISSISSLS